MNDNEWYDYRPSSYDGPVEIAALEQLRPKGDWFSREEEFEHVVRCAQAAKALTTKIYPINDKASRLRDIVVLRDLSRDMFNYAQAVLDADNTQST